MGFPFAGRREPWNIYWDYTYNTASGTCTAMAGPGVLGRIFINGGTMGIITVTDNTAASGGAGTIASFTPSVTGQSFIFDIRCKVGCSVFASAATSYTVTYMR